MKCGDSVGFGNTTEPIPCPFTPYHTTHPLSFHTISHNFPSHKITHSLLPPFFFAQYHIIIYPTFTQNQTLTPPTLLLCPVSHNPQIPLRHTVSHSPYPSFLTNSHTVTLFHTISHTVTLFHTISHTMTLFHTISHTVTLFHTISRTLFHTHLHTAFPTNSS